MLSPRVCGCGRVGRNVADAALVVVRIPRRRLDQSLKLWLCEVPEGLNGLDCHAAMLAAASAGQCAVIEPRLCRL